MLKILKNIWNSVRGLDEDGFPINGDCPCCVDEPECVCCERALEEGHDCICKEDQVVEIGDEIHRWRSRAECTDYDCSYCH